jgi:cell division inhibitor SepF
MAGIMDKFKKMWDSPDDEFKYEDDYGYEPEEESYDDGYDRSSEREYRRAERTERRRSSFDTYSDSDNGNKVVNINTNANIKVAIFKPERFGDDIKEIADEIIRNSTVVLNLEETNRDMCRRIIDFVSGVTYAKQGKIRKVASGTFIIMPSNVDLTGDDLLDELENNGIFFK